MKLASFGEQQSNASLDVRRVRLASLIGLSNSHLHPDQPSTCKCRTMSSYFALCWVDRVLRGAPGEERVEATNSLGKGMEFALPLQITQHLQFWEPRHLQELAGHFTAPLIGSGYSETSFLHPLGLGGSLWSCLICFSLVTGVPTLTFYKLPPARLRNKSGTFDLLLGDQKLCHQKSRLAFASFPFLAMSPFSERWMRMPCWGWTGKGSEVYDGGRGQPSRIFESVPHAVFSLSYSLIKLVQVRVQGGALRQLAGSLCPPKALREMRLWFQSWSHCRVLMWSHMKSLFPWDNGRRIRRKAPVTLTGRPKMLLRGCAGWTFQVSGAGRWPCPRGD